MGNNTDESKKKALSSRWYKAEIIFKAIASIMIPAAIASIGFLGEKSIRNSQEREALTQILTETANQREFIQTGIHKEMLNSVLVTFTEGKTHTYLEKALAIELLVHHFSDLVNIKPIFSGFRNELLNGHYEVDREEINLVLNRLETVAREINEKQLALLEAVGKKIDRDINLEELRTKRDEGGFNLLKDRLELDTIETQFRLRALDFNEKHKEIKVRLGITIPGENSEKIVDFWIGYFDFPSINNIRLAEDQRCAVVLRDFDIAVSDAFITLVYFPKPYKSLIEKQIYKTVVNEYREGKLR